MRFWFVRSGEVSLHRQITTQVMLGILAGELAPGERLPSIRAFARRFELHPNTVSTAYRELERERWVDMRRGSGVYVRERVAAVEDPGTTPHASLELLLTHAIRAGRAAGLSDAQLQERFRQRLVPPRPQRLLLVEPERGLGEIVLTELAGRLSLPIAKVASLADAGDLAGALVTVLPSKAEATRAALPAGVPLHVLAIRSIPAWLTPWLPPPQDALVAIVSCWPRFLTLANTMLVAAGLAPEAMLLRDACEPGWKDGLGQVQLIITESHTAGALPAGVRSVVFPLLSEETIAELAAHRPA